MPELAPVDIFRIHLAFGYLAWGLCTVAFIWPWLSRIGSVQAQRAIATLHSFRFFGLVFLLPGFVGEGLPPAFAGPAAWGDLATAVLATLALISVRAPRLFWTLVTAYTIVGVADLLLDTVHAVQLDLPRVAGRLGAAYAIPILYVPLLMWTHACAGLLMLRPVVSARSASLRIAQAPR